MKIFKWFKRRADSEPPISAGDLERAIKHLRDLVYYDGADISQYRRRIKAALSLLGGEEG